MKRLILLAALLTSSASALSATAQLKKADGKDVGTVTFTEVPGGLQLTVRATGLTPGRHGLHVHEKGLCVPGADAATNAVIPFGGAGGHFDPGMSLNHATPGTPNRLGHGGDLPMLRADASGNASLTFTTSKMSLTGMDGVLRRSIMLHAQPDDYKSDPAGMTGARVACGVILRDEYATRRYDLPGSATFPEGVAVDAARGLLFTGSASDGTIYAINASTGATSIYSPGGAMGRTSALGLKVDTQGRLWAAGGATGTVSVLGKDGVPLVTLATPDSPQAYLNDLISGPDGNVYVTDSRRPVIFRITPDLKRVEAWLDLRGTPIQYEEGLNLNGITLTPDGKALLTVQYNTGKLFRIELASKRVREVPVPRGLKYGDGLLLIGRTLYVSQNRENRVAKVEMNAALTAGRITATSPADGLRFPTTLASIGGDLVAVNGQLDKQSGGTPEVPFVLTRFGKF